MDFENYEYVNREVSSEMFFSLMGILHEKLPLGKNFYRLRTKYRKNKG